MCGTGYQGFATETWPIERSALSQGVMHIPSCHLGAFSPFSIRTTTTITDHLVIMSFILKKYPDSGLYGPSDHLIEGGR